MRKQWYGILFFVILGAVLLGMVATGIVTGTDATIYFVMGILSGLGIIFLLVDLAKNG